MHILTIRKKCTEIKLIALKNAEWTKGARTAKPMEARPVISDIPKSVMRNPIPMKRKNLNG
jgi:hypothetical protein